VRSPYLLFKGIILVFVLEIRSLQKLFGLFFVTKMQTHDMKKENYSHLMGKTRREIMKEIGCTFNGFNYFRSKTWTYEVGKTWLGKKIVLSLTFTDEKVSEIILFSSFKRC
jgi:hypothetical protein